VSRLQDVLSEENRRKIDLSSVSFGASSDAKISIRKFESVGVFSSFSMTFSLDAFTGELPVDELLNEIVIPLRKASLTLLILPRWQQSKNYELLLKASMQVSLLLR